MVKVTAEAITGSKLFLIRKDNPRTIRIDLIQKIEGLTVVINPEIYELVE